MVAATDSPAAAQRVPARRYVVFFAIAAVGCALDLYSKHRIFQELGYEPPLREITIWPGVLSLTTNLNEGALFGMGQGLVPIFALLSGVAAVIILYWLFIRGAARDGLLNIALALVFGGILGNLYDRLGLPGLLWKSTSPLHQAGEPMYAVRDWIHFQIPGLLDWPIFNIADSLLVCGAFLLGWHALFHAEGVPQNPRKTVQNT